MYNIKKYRHYTIFLYIFFIIILILLSVTIWNGLVKEEHIINKSLLFIYLILILGICTAKFIIGYRLTNKDKIDRNIQKIVDDEKAKLTAEHKKQDIKEEVITETKKDIDKAVKKIFQNTQNLKNIKLYTEKLLANLSKELEIVQGIFYVKARKTNQFTVAGEYAYTGEKKAGGFKLGDTIPGQAAKDKNIIIIDDIPEKYLSAESGLGKSIPRYLVFVPVISKGKAVAVMELASFKEIDDAGKSILKELSSNMGDKIDKFVN